MNGYRYHAETDFIDLPEDVGGTTTLDKLIEENMMDCVLLDHSLSFNREEKKAVLKTISNRAVRPAIAAFLTENPVGDFDRLVTKLRNLCHIVGGKMEDVEAEAFAMARLFIRDQAKTEDFCHA
jgi:hypothetical protein